MALEEIILAFLVVIVAILLVLYFKQRKELELLGSAHKELGSSYKSKVVIHGKNWEVFAPFMKDFENVASKENFRFLGNPIDGIAFDDDEIKFIEFKTGKSSLSPKQKHIKSQVQSKKVKWIELHFGDA